MDKLHANIINQIKRTKLLPVSILDHTAYAQQYYDSKNIKYDGALLNSIPNSVFRSYTELLGRIATLGIFLAFDPTNVVAHRRRLVYTYSTFGRYPEHVIKLLESSTNEHIGLVVIAGTHRITAPHRMKVIDLGTDASLDEIQHVLMEKAIVKLTDPIELDIDQYKYVPLHSKFKDRTLRTVDEDTIKRYIVRGGLLNANFMDDTHTLKYKPDWLSAFTFSKCERRQFRN